jgi:hypothetical protein
MKKKLILAVFLGQSVSANAELSNFTDIPGGKTAAAAWDSKYCSVLATDTSETIEANCHNSEQNNFYTPTVLFFDKQGSLIKSIPFADDQCAYQPVALSRKGNNLILTVRVGGGVNIFSDVAGTNISNYYPNCQYDNDSMIRETRRLKDGKLLSRIVLQNYRTATLP